MLTPLLSCMFTNISLHLRSLFLNFKVLNKHNCYKIIIYELHVLLVSSNFTQICKTTFITFTGRLKNV